MSVNLGSMIVNLGLDTLQMTRGIATANRSLDKMVARAKRAGQQTRAMGIGLSAAITAPIIGASIFSLKAAADLETMQVSFESMLGSAENATAMMTDLKKFSAGTPFQLSDIGKATKTLLSFGIASEDVLDSMKFLGDIAAGANIPLGDIASTFGKIKARGKAMTEELNMLSDRGIPILDALAKSFGVSKNEIFEMASQSKLTADIVEKALRGMSEEGGMFEDQMAKQSKTLAGIWSTLKDNIFLLAAEFGNAIAETGDLKEVMGDLIGLAQQGVKWFKELDKETRKNILAGLALAAALGPVLIILGSIISISASAVGALAAIAGSTVLAPLLLVGLAIAAIVLGLREVAKESKKSQAAMQEMGEESKKSAETANLSWTEHARAFGTVWEVIQENVKFGFNAFSLLLAQFFTEIAVGILGLVEGMDKLSDKAVGALEGLGLLAPSEAKALKEVFQPDFEEQRQTLNQIKKEQDAEVKRHNDRLKEIMGINLPPPTPEEIQAARDAMPKPKKPGSPAAIAAALPSEPVQKFAGATEFGSLQDFRIRRGLLSREDKIQKENVDANKKTADNTAEAKDTLKEISDKLDNNNTVGI